MAGIKMLHKYCVIKKEILHSVSFLHARKTFSNAKHLNIQLSEVDLVNELSLMLLLW